jgi:hypothetical protein
MTFEDWMEQVEDELDERTGMTSNDLPDYPYGDAYETDMTPEEVVTDLLGMNNALAVATAAHIMQKYAGGPFIEHPKAVVTVLHRYGITDPDVLCAGYLHDTVEDTVVTVEDIRMLFGDDVADIVWRVTDAPGATRAIRKAATYPKIAGRDEAIIVKMADRIANCIQGGKKGNGGKRAMYQAEHADFVEAMKMSPTSVYYSTFQKMMQELNELLNGTLPWEKDVLAKEINDETVAG